MHGITRYVGAGLLLLMAAACSSDGTGGSTTGMVEVRLTDAPSDEFQSATIFVSQVALQPSDAAASVVIVSNTKAAFDLLTLQDGVTAELANTSVPTGSYSQIRLIVDSARVVLKNGNTFANGTTTATLKVPSGSESGLKVNFSGPVLVTTGQTVLIIDFDLSQSFVFQGPRTHPNSVLLKPVLHATALNVAASISGTITPLTSAAAVYAIAGTDTVQTTFADATTGAYTLSFLPPGTYVVAARATGFQVSVSASVTLGNSQILTGVNLLLVP
jgi:Domain of unknown function (DUF4382)/Carboxypeptidase regulatory-like domain